MNNLRATLEQNTIDASSLNQVCQGDNGVISTISTAGADAVALWQKLRAMVEHTEHWPVIVGDQEALQLFVESCQEGDTDASDAIAQGLKLNALDWLQKREAERAADWEDESFSDVHGEWPEDVEPASDFAAPFNFITKKPHRKVFIALVPTLHCWEVPAVVGFGGWNECPSPEEHAAVIKHWHEKYGAELVSLSGDTIKMKVKKPPTDREAAMALAREQFIYCEDIVSQGTQSIERLAASLLNGTVWFFWWD